MYLKSIEIHGFKSFANKIVFDFREGITGIVGPNGSGKSNVADAVRWVLGEQKIKQLRGSKMEDVIFAGTSNRKPQSYAYVAITLDNSDHKLKIDFDEVTISRRVYRSGESEYMINGSVCRLKDVNELFYDTGIGKEGYSIIGQGQIDRILQGKPEERREIFDEAVGIVKYRKRKTLALRKLESERSNLARVSDILTEIKRQVGPLKKQSEAAEQFVVLKNELTKYDINLFLMENGETSEKIVNYKKKEEIASAELEAARLDLEKTRSEFEQLIETIAEIDARIDEVRNSISRHNIIRENLNGQINVLMEQIHSAQEAQGSFRERVQDISEQIAAAEKEKEVLLSDKEKNRKDLAQAVSASAQKDSQVLDLQGNNEEKRLQIVALKEQLLDITGRRGTLIARMERLNATLDQMKQRRENLAASLEKISSDKESREKEAEKLFADHEEARKNVSETEDDLQKKEASLKETETKIRQYSDEISAARDKMVRSQAALESLRNITERYEGYGNTIKEVMKLKDEKQGIIGIVADIIRTEKRYETAIETALGGSIQNIVTDTEATAKNTIEYLKKNRLGRATFLPLKAVTGRGEFRNVDVLEENGVIGLASSLVNSDKKYEGVISFLLGKIVVVDTVDHALLIARKYNYSLILVTLEGELLNRGGSISGGAFKNRSNLLGRRREMEELESAIASFKETMNELTAASERCRKSRDEITAEIELVKAQLQEHRLYLNTVEINLKAARERSLEIENDLKNADMESKSIDEETNSIQGENSSLSGQLTDNEQENQSVKDRINALEQELDAAKEKEAQENLLSQTLKVDLSRLREQSTHISESLSRVDNTLVKLNNDLSEMNSSNDHSGQLIKERNDEIEQIRKSVSLADEEISSEKAKLADLEKEKVEKAGSHHEFITKREELSQHIADLDKELFRLTSMREKLEERFETRANYIWDEYQLTYNNALPMRDETLKDAKEMRGRIGELKNTIRSLGVINVSAIEEYKEVRERYEFLSGQHEDLVKAESSLVKIIRDLDREMRRQFNEEFKKIRTEFGKVFRQMFGGGTGTIELEEDVDVLEAGISIIAQPPGKKLQNMMQLSGGEKALTAIALLFAIQNLKPSPFCILDEIEAALDDSNITRFAEYLHKLTDHTQFIVITHRKGTMEAADRLYGITMQERGVSTLISVDLADVEDEQAG